MSVFSRGLLTCMALTMASMCVMLAAGRHDLAHVGVEGDAADGVLLAQQQVARQAPTVQA